MSPCVRVAVFVPLLLLAAGAARAADPAKPADAAQPEDPSVQPKLEARGLKYEVSDGDYKLVFSFEENKRTQIVFVSGTTEEFGAMKVREVFAPAARLKDGITGAVALEMLENNRTRKIGAWEIGGDVLYYVVKLPDTVDAEQLELAMEVAAQTADELELRFSGDRDEL